MTTIKEYYSDVLQANDKRMKSTCEHCNKTFKTIDTLLEIPEDDDYNEDEIVERCPLCSWLIK